MSFHCDRKCPRAELGRTPDYFALFGLTPALNVDEDALRQAYFAKSRETHPDLHPDDTDEEREERMACAAQLNDGWRELRKLVPRAEALTRFYGLSPDKERYQPPPAMLMRVFELNELLEEIGESDDPASRSGELDQVREELEGDRRDAEAKLVAIGDRWAALGEPPANREALDAAGPHRALLDEIRHELARLSYAGKLARDIENIKAGKGEKGGS